MAPLPTFRIEPSTLIAQTQPQASSPVTLASPALQVMTDLTAVKAATIAPGSSLYEAEQVMISQGVRMLFVVTGLPSFEGIVTTTDLSGDRVLRIVNARSLHYDELTVADVMTPIGSLDAIEFARLRPATVGAVIATLRRFGRNHLLVVEPATATTPRRVRGVISRAQIERQLGQLVELSEIASSFAEIERALV
jgi:signal-transduction protein with cAMP-binding, CBS, and nucleotidyltransferase domain